MQIYTHQYHPWLQLQVIVDTINATHTAVTKPGKIPAPILNNNVGNIIVNADANVPIVTTCDCGIIF